MDAHIFGLAEITLGIKIFTRNTSLRNFVNFLKKKLELILFLKRNPTIAKYINVLEITLKIFPIKIKFLLAELKLEIIF